MFQMIYTKRLEMIQRYEEEEGKGGKKKRVRFIQINKCTKEDN